MKLETTVVSKSFLNELELEQVKSLENHCAKNDSITLKLELDYKESLAKEGGGKTSFSNEFMCKIDDQVVAYVGICGFDGMNLEVSGMVYPKYRRRGIFSELIALVLEEFRKREEKTLLFLCDSTSKSGQEFLNSLNVKYSFSEFEMYLKKMTAPPVKNDETLSYRKATNDDANVIANQNVVYFGKPVEKIEMPLPEIEEARGMTIYLALMDDVIIGKVNVQLYDDEAGIYGLGVLPDYRGKGYGREILNFAVVKSKEASAKNIVLQVEAKNQKALNLYTSCGFEVTSKMDYFTWLTN